LLLVGCVGIAKAQTSSTQQMYPQIVRLSYVSGDVRLERGAAAEKATGAEWEKAAVDVPIYSGFTLVTGSAGRAEVEFEDASHVYLDENSVLSFGDLSANASSRITELNLVSGVMTIDAQNPRPGELIMVRTPANGFWLKYPWTSFLRVNSYLDGMELTPMSGSTKITAPGGVTDTNAGQKMVFKGGEKTPSLVPIGVNAFADWDAWVRARSADYSQAMKAAMKDAGLNAPVPGLTEIAAQGSFFDCAPYGKCWAPKEGWDGDGGVDGSGAAPVEGNENQQAAPARAPVAPAINSQSMAAPVAATPMLAGMMPCTQATRSNCVVDDYYFPCSPSTIRNFYDRDPVTRKLRLVFSEPNIGVNGYNRSYLWGVCHTGSWIRYHRRYVWVAGTHRHHRWGVRWVKVGGKTGFVPVHPRDVAGKPPLNIKHGVYLDAGKKDHGTVIVKVSEPVKLLDGTPKEFAKLTYPALPKSEAPHMEVHQLHEGNTSHHDGPVQLSHATLSFDHKTQGFQVEHTVLTGGHEHTVSEPIGGHGGMPVNRGESYNNRGADSGYRGGSQNGGFNGGGGASRSYSGPSEGAHSSAPASMPSAPSAPISAPSAPSAPVGGGARH